MEHHEQPKYGGSSPWNWSSQACAGGGMTDHSVGIEMSGIFFGVYEGFGVGAGFGLDDNGDWEGSVLNDMYVHHASFPYSPSDKY